MSVKWLELLKEIAPRVERVAVVYASSNPGGVPQFAAIQSIAPALGVEIVPIEKIVSTDDFGEGFENVEAFKNVDLPKGMMLTALFDDHGQKTTLTLVTSHQSVEDKKKHEAIGVVAGWNSSFDKMDEYLKTVQR